MTRDQADFLFVFLWFLGYGVVYFIVWQQKSAHIRRQNGLLEKCRALFIIASQHIEQGDTEKAQAFLSRIRAIEERWKVGNSRLVRFAVTIKSIAFATIAAALMRFTPLPFKWTGDQPYLDRFAADLALSTAILLLPLLHALIANALTPWHELHLIDDIGDRLAKILKAGRGIATPREAGKNTGRSRDGLSDLEVLGLPASYTKSQLRQARNRMAARFHPDFAAAGNAAEQVRMTDAMQRINSAYDRLLKALDR